MTFCGPLLITNIAALISKRDLRAAHDLWHINVLMEL